MSSKRSTKKKRMICLPKSEAASTQHVVFSLLSDLIRRGVEGGAYRWCLRKNADPKRTVFVTFVPADMADGIICAIMARTLNRGFVEIVDTIKSDDSIYQSILVQAEGNIDGDSCPTLICCEDCPLGYWIMIIPAEETDAELLAKKSQAADNVLSPFELEESCSSGKKQNKSSKDPSVKVTAAVKDQPPASKEQSMQVKVPVAAKDPAQCKVPAAAKDPARCKVPPVVVKEHSLPEHGQLDEEEVSLPAKATPAPKEQLQQIKVQTVAKEPSKEAKVVPATHWPSEAEMSSLVSKALALTPKGSLATGDDFFSDHEQSQSEQSQQVKMSLEESVRQAYLLPPAQESLKVPQLATKESPTSNMPLTVNEHSFSVKVLPGTNEPLLAPKVASILKELSPPSPPANMLPPALPSADEQPSQVKMMALAKSQSSSNDVLPLPKDLLSSVQVSLKPVLITNENRRNSQTILNDPKRMVNLPQSSSNPVLMDSSPNMSSWAQDGIKPPVMNLPNKRCNAVWKGDFMERQKRREDIRKGLQFIQSTIPFHGSQDEFKHFLQELVENLFKEGNDLYREGEIKPALGQYTEGFTVADYAASEELVLSQDLVCKLLVNRSCCYSTMGLHEKSLEDSDKALELDVENTKALYRKAKALDKLGKHQEAYSCISHRILTLVQDKSITQLAQQLVQKLGLKQRRAYKRPQQELETLGLIRNGIATTADSKASNSMGSVDDIYTDLPGDPNLFTSSLGINSQNNVVETVSSPPSVSSTVTPTANAGNDLTDDIIGDELDSFLDYDMASKRIPIIPVFPTGNPLSSVLRPTVLPAPSPLPSASFGLIDTRKPPVVPTLPPLRPAFGLRLDTLDNFDTIRDSLDSLDTFANESRPMDAGPLKGSPNLKVEPAPIHAVAVPPAFPINPLMQNYEFRQGCEKCYVKTGPKILDYTHRERLDHKCNKDILLARMKSSENKQWLKIRPRPMKVNFNGPFMLCKDIQSRQTCKYGDNCTFAYYQEEIDVWNEERKGTFHRDKLFQPLGLVKPGTVSRLLHEQKGIFTFLCQACFDSKPRIISKRNPEHTEFCTNPTNQHVFNDNRCLVHVLNSSTVKYSKIRPLLLRFQMDVCRHEIRHGCIQEDTCNFAHSHVELKVWLLQKQSGITQEEIVLESERMWKIPEPKAKPLPKPLDMKMKFVCGQCLSHGREIEADRDGKYCAAKARHSWTKDRVLLVMSKSKMKWVPVRPLPSIRSFPQHYEICVHIKKGKKCQYVGSCSFAHNTEEKDVWTYMKESRVVDLQQVFDLCNKSHNPAEKPGMTATGTTGAQKEAEKQILMPTDYADLMAGFHCYLCGKNSNSEKQWQKHIQSEKHKDRVFTLESEDSAWKYRFPAGEFKLCERYEETHRCPNENNCPFAHGMEELKEWQERKEVLQLKVSKARKDKLLDPSDSDFGIYTFLMQDLAEMNVKKESTDPL